MKPRLDPVQGLAGSQGSCSTARPVLGTNTGPHLSSGHRVWVAEAEGTSEGPRANALLKQGHLEPATQDRMKKPQ